jgi:hypothetical protein
MTERFGQEEGAMSKYELNFRSQPVHGQNARNPHRAGATVIAFPPLGTTATGSTSSRAGGGNRTGTATLLPFLQPGSSPPARSVPSSRSAAKSASGADQGLITQEQEYRQRMFENLLAAGWVATLMSAGYLLKVLAAPSMF